MHLLGVGTTSFSRTGRTTRELAQQAAAAALADAGLSAGDVSAVTVATGGEPDSGAAFELLGDRAGRPLPPPCELGLAALYAAWRAVASGESDVVLCLGHDPSPATGDPPALDELAEAAEAYMGRSGATEGHFARVAAKNRAQGADNPRAPRNGPPADAGAVLASDVLVWPLRRLMVAAPSQGAAAVVLAARDLGRRGGASAPRLRACVLLDAGAGGRAVTARAARLAYNAARLGPEDVDCAEIDHPTAAGEIAAYEALELAPDGHGPELVESGFTALGGVVPVNTSGGALAQGLTAGAAGIVQLCELGWQLRGEAGRRQVAGARVGLSLAGGHAGRDGVVALTILSLD
ncbi:MAG TPA: thiolase family protein [Thermoleophilaceae bacterium]